VKDARPKNISTKEKHPNINLSFDSAHDNEFIGVDMRQ
jgi:hypothetical protein